MIETTAVANISPSVRPSVRPSFDFLPCIASTWVELRRVRPPHRLGRPGLALGSVIGSSGGLFVCLLVRPQLTAAQI